MTVEIRSSRGATIFLRALIWSLFGVVYAPLFTGLNIGCHALGAEGFAFVPAAAVAGAVGAAFYGAREVALIATAIGLTVATVVFFVWPGALNVVEVASVAGLSGMLLGILVRFPDRCSRGVPGKAMAGLAAGALCGVALMLAEPHHAEHFQIGGILAFLVSVNGILYVASVRWWVRIMTPRRSSRYCNLIESVVIGILAACAAGALWLVVGPLFGLLDTSEIAVSNALQRDVPAAVMGGLIGGAVGGALLEAFRFRTVYDL
ncbi:hypothetical protein Thimo_1709 [Thioflavicoccus mobilis 8321]|uniref:Uncharacterized protein n=1 Tax=Thioflavicoccus mobilis 8321 TaxID=765912 RepID=L0GX02_9GAMM|nr:hypothetical protein [Thioflavicoccus mobilis]AGA90486.1 hypothetical protein Thimo_1709 [Thioflavicoccus mobilis 8321]